MAAAEAVAAAMHAVLPGIDANDEKKTRAVFRFYCLVLSSIGELKVDLPTAYGSFSKLPKFFWQCKMPFRNAVLEIRKSLLPHHISGFHKEEQVPLQLAYYWLQSDTSGLPLFKEEWLDDLLARIFELLRNLDSPETRSDLSVSGQPGGHTEVQSFLLNDDCMFRYFAQPSEAANTRA